MPDQCMPDCMCYLQVHDYAAKLQGKLNCSLHISLTCVVRKVDAQRKTKFHPPYLSDFLPENVSAYELQPGYLAYELYDTSGISQGFLWTAHLDVGS